MSSWYRCDACGCYLDPGEGLLCDECREVVRRRVKHVKQYEEAVREADSGQYEMKLLASGLRGENIGAYHD